MKKTLLYFLAVILCNSYLTAQTTFETKVTINPSTGANPYVIDSGELSGDAYNDIVIATYANTLEWYKNNGDGTFTLQTLVSTTLSGPSSVHIADVDGINGNDILATAYNTDKLVWYANDGAGNFGPEQVISSAIDGAGAIVTGLIDGDATLDVAVIAYNSGDSVWFANNGSGVFTGPNTIASVPGSGPGDIDLADFDGDGDLDVVIANSDNGTIEIYDNNLVPSGTVSFTKYTNSVDTSNVYLFDVAFADVNDDDVLDIIKSDIGAPGEVSYYTKDAVGVGTTFTEITITTSIVRPATATVADLDNDTYNDILISNATTGPTPDVLWVESTDIGTFNTESIIDNSQKQVFAVTINDFDNDGDLDIATIDYQDADLNWFENNLITLSVSDFAANTISIYPNPTKGVLNFKGFSSETLNVSVYDVLGKNVLNVSLDVNKPLDVSNLKTGIYIIKFVDLNKTFKFVKE